MKRKILISLLMLSMFIGGVVTASSINGDFKGRPIVKVFVNGKTVSSEVPAYIEDGNTMLPLRAVSEALGADIKWNPDDYSVSVSTKKAALTQDQLKEISKSIALIYVYDQSGTPISQGSGFVIENSKYGKLLITNCHVACKGPKLRAEINGEVISLTDQKLFANTQTDVWAAKISTAAPALPYRVDIAQEGTPVWAFAYPNASYQTANSTISKVESIEGSTMLTHGATLDHGSSGGALTNANGEVIGITTGGYDGTQKNEATPISYVQQEIDNLK